MDLSLCSLRNATELIDSQLVGRIEQLHYVVSSELDLSTLSPSMATT
jgi:hypothetical protein